MSESEIKIVEETSPSVSLDQIMNITAVEAERLETVLPEEWKTDFQYFLENYRKDRCQRKKPIRENRPLSMLCNKLDKWLEKKEYENYKTDDVEILRKEVKKRLWISLNPDLKDKLLKVLNLKKPENWVINDLKKWDKEIYRKFIRNGIKTEEDVQLVLGEDSLVLHEYKLGRRNTTDWSRENEIECRFSNFLLFHCTPQKTWGFSDLDVVDSGLYQKFYNLGIRNSKDDLVSFLGVNGEELLDIYPPEPQQLNPELAKEKLKDFLIRELKPGYRWDFNLLKEYNINLFNYIRDRISGDTIEDRILNLIGEENKELLILCPLKLPASEWIKKATGENCDKWNEKLHLIAMSNFFKEFPEAQKRWRPKMIAKWNNGFYCSLKNTYRTKENKNNWKEIIEAYVPDEYKNNFAWREEPIYLATAEYSGYWNEHLYSLAMSNFFKEIPGAQKQWSPRMILEWNKSFYSSLINTYRNKDDKPNWEEILKKHVPSQYKDKFLWTERSIYLATGEYARYWNERLYRIAMSSFFKEVPEAQKQWNHDLLEKWNEGLCTSLISQHRFNGDVDWETIIQNFVPLKYQSKFIWRGVKSDFTKREAERSFGTFAYIENTEEKNLPDYILDDKVDSNIIKGILFQIEPTSRETLIEHFYKEDDVCPDELAVALNQMRLHLKEFSLNSFFHKNS